MNKILTGFLCVLGLAITCMPAYANPTDKKITLDCSSSEAGEVVYGDATVTLCDELTSTSPCVESVTCQVTCESDAVPPSQTISCSTDTANPPFKVHAMTAQINFRDSEGNTGGSAPSVTLTGKGFFTAVGPDSDPQTETDTDSDTETVSLTVK